MLLTVISAEATECSWRTSSGAIRTVGEIHCGPCVADPRFLAGSVDRDQRERRKSLGVNPMTNSWLVREQAPGLDGPMPSIGPPPVVLQVAGLGKVYGDLRAVSDMSFTVRGGEVLGLVGPNGAGKTTTLRCL